MLDESGSHDLDDALTVRSLYLIDPSKKLRLAMVYPISTGRDIEYVPLGLFFIKHHHH